MKQPKTFTIFFAIGEWTKTGIVYAISEEMAKEKLLAQYPKATNIRVLKGRMCFEAEIITGIKEEEEE